MNKEVLLSIIKIMQEHEMDKLDISIETICSHKTAKAVFSKNDSSIEFRYMLDKLKDEKELRTLNTDKGDLTEETKESDESCATEDNINESVSEKKESDESFVRKKGIDFEEERKFQKEFIKNLKKEGYHLVG